MKALMSDPVASALVVVGETGRASLTDIARAAGKPLSTMQRALDGLVKGGVLRRESPRGAFVFRPNAPKRALRELAEWHIGPRRTQQLAVRARATPSAIWPPVPSTIKSEPVRRAWPTAIETIVNAWDPAQVILFGSQARGDSTPDSDVDLLVVFDHVDDRRERQVEIRRLLRDMPFAKDVLVASVDDIAHPMAGTALAEAVREGLVVYER